METFLQKPRGCRSGIKDKQSAETVDGKGTGRGASENKLTSQQHYRLLKPSSPESETEKLSAGKLRHGVPKQKESCRDEEYGTERVGRHRSGELTDGRETWMEERERERLQWSRDLDFASRSQLPANSPGGIYHWNFRQP